MTLKKPKIISSNADLAEKYTIVQDESEWQIGHVVCVNRDPLIDADVEVSQEVGSSVVVGVISGDPAFLMNSDMENGVDVAIKGRVSCFVQGPVAKGVNLISGEDGIAIPITDPLTIPPMAKLFAYTNEIIEHHEIKLIEIII